MREPFLTPKAPIITEFRIGDKVYEWKFTKSVSVVIHLDCPENFFVGVKRLKYCEDLFEPWHITLIARKII